jgi:DNA-binding transcriptional regulator YdaS (Cro superfamily)
VNNTHPTQRLVKKKQLAFLLGVSPRTVDQWVHRRWIPVIAPTARLHLFDPSEVRQAIKSRFGIQAQEVRQ